MVEPTRVMLSVAHWQRRQKRQRQAHSGHPATSPSLANLTRDLNSVTHRAAAFRTNQHHSNHLLLARWDNISQNSWKCHPNTDILLRKITISTSIFRHYTHTNNSLQFAEHLKPTQKN